MQSFEAGVGNTIEVLGADRDLVSPPLKHFVRGDGAEVFLLGDDDLRRCGTRSNTYVCMYTSTDTPSERGSIN